MANKRVNNQRRENYRFYRSIGYSVKQATNLRNKSPHRMIEEFRNARSEFNEARYAKYRGEAEKIEAPKPYRPKIEVNEVDYSEYRFEFFSEYNVPGHIIDQMTAENSFFDLEIYSERLQGLQDHFENKGMDWTELMDYLGEIQDLGDWLDALGELYDEN